MCAFHAQLAQWEAAIPWCSKSAAGLPEVFYPLAILAGADGLAGHDREAKDAAAQLQSRLHRADLSWDPPALEQRSDLQRAIRARGRRPAQGGVPEGEAKKD
jgi:hypothetical protein